MSTTLTSADQPMLNLTFKKVHKSIQSFESQSLPKFSIITGVNGSGKTHLLTAIAEGAIAIDSVPHSQTKLYNTQNFQASIEEAATPQAAYKERVTIAENFYKQRERILGQFSRQLEAWGINMPMGTNDFDLFVKTEDELDSILELIDKNNSGKASYKKGIKQQITQLTQQLRAHLNNHIFQLDYIAEQNQCSLFELTSLQVQDSLVSASLDNSMRLKLASQFTSWLAAFEFNKINKYYATQEGKNLQYVEEEEFYRIHGREPWVTANRILDLANLPYHFNAPSGTFYDLQGAYQLRLVDKQTGCTVTIADLSSGEKALLALVSLRYQADSGFGIKSLPTVFLLDEIDAHLHPSFTKVVLQSLKEHFVDQGIAVIMATHSPSTVALAERFGAEIFELTRADKELRKISSSTASSILSSGFLSVFPDDQIIICEAIDDADYYQKIHNSLVQRELIPSSPTLRFIPASNKANAGVGGGCAQAKQWADKLSDLNLSKFRGLIDWDPRQDSNTESDNVSVLKRSALENYLLDPLTLLSILVDSGAASLFPMWSNASQTSTSLLNEPPELIQSMVEKLEELIDLPNETKISTSYVGGMEIDISEEWQQERGHTLQERIGEKFNSLPIIKLTNKIIGTDGTSPRYIDYQTNKHSGLIPICLVETLGSLKEAIAHPQVAPTLAIPVLSS